jgi:hypothetical protein
MSIPILVRALEPDNAHLLAAALNYMARGWSIIPVIGKKPVVGWKKFQERPATEQELREAFANPRVTGLAVILGTVSGGLAARDFDTVISYEAWAAAYPDLATSLPTVQTARGFHVYFRISRESFHTFDDDSGELRADSKHIDVLPPSRHPDGPLYRWTIPLQDTEPPFLDPWQVGLCNREDRANRRIDSAAATAPTLLPMFAAATPSTPSSVVAVSSLSSLLQEEIERAIAASLPTALRQRHKSIFRLARELKAIEALNSAGACDLRHIVEEWHRRALPVIRSKSFVETWADFVLAWKNVRVPAGQGVINTALSRALASAPSPRVVELYDENEIILLAKLCRELQLIVGDVDFFLDCRTAGELIGVHHSTAWRYFVALVADGILTPGEKGSALKRKASRFRYIDP